MIDMLLGLLIGILQGIGGIVFCVAVTLCALALIAGGAACVWLILESPDADAHC